MKSLKNDIAIIGSGGHSRSVISLLQVLGIKPTCIFDDSFHPEDKENILGVPLTGKLKDCSSEYSLVLAVGDNSQRESVYRLFASSVITETSIHPSAIVESSVDFGDANIVFAKSYINAVSSIGDNNIINSGCIIEHECTIGNHCHFSIGSILGGRVTVGDRCFIGTGAIIKDQVIICDDTTIGAGSVVLKDILEPGIYAGVPIKKIK